MLLKADMSSGPCQYLLLGGRRLSGEGDFSRPQAIRVARALTSGGHKKPEARLGKW